MNDLAPHYLSPAKTFALWVLALPLFLAGLGTPVVQRTQEARVVETAREMYDSPVREDWMIPRCNGDVRLNKPPLEYWLPALCYKMFGVNEFAARLPFALAGWLTLVVVYRFGRALLGPTFGLLSAAVLLTSYMFFRHSRLAETDGLSAFFLTVGVYWLYRGAVEARRPRSFLYLHLAMASLGLVVMSKGPPAAFAILFFIAWIAVEQNWAALARLLISGSVLTGLVIGGSWYFAIRHTPQFSVLLDEVKVVTGGEDHKRLFTMYFPLLLLATAPWTAFLLAGTTWAVRFWRRDPAARVLMLWNLAVLVPLCAIGNKQNHYLISMVAPLAMLTAYAIYRGLMARTDQTHRTSPVGFWWDERRVVRGLFRATLIVSVLAPVGIYVAARQQRGMLMNIDFILAILVVAGVAMAASVGRRHGLFASVLTYAAAVAVTFTVLHARWTPTLRPVDHRTIATALSDAFPGRPCVFYGKLASASLPLVWNKREIIPVCTDEPRLRDTDQPTLRDTLAGDPQTVVIAQTKNNVTPPPIPSELHLRAQFEIIGEDPSTFRVYTLDP